MVHYFYWQATVSVVRKFEKLTGGDPNEGRKPSLKTRDYAQKPRLKILFKNSISGFYRNSCCPGFHQRSPTLHTDSESDALVIANSESELEREDPVAHLQVQLVFWILTSSVADPDPGPVPFDPGIRDG
jgi:hypothetical protein